MASEYETEAQAELEAAAREQKVVAFLNSGYANQVADLALASYWDHIQARLRAEKIGRDLQIGSFTGGLSSLDNYALQSTQAEAEAESAAHFGAAAAYAAIAGAVAIAKSHRTPEA